MCAASRRMLDVHPVHIARCMDLECYSTTKVRTQLYTQVRDSHELTDKDTVRLSSNWMMRRLLHSIYTLGLDISALSRVYPPPPAAQPMHSRPQALVVWVTWRQRRTHCSRTRRYQVRTTSGQMASVKVDTSISDSSKLCPTCSRYSHQKSARRAKRIKHVDQGAVRFYRRCSH